MLPKDLPPFIGMPNYFYAWRDIGVLGAIHNKIILVTREQAAGGGEPIRQSQRQQVRQDCKHHIATDTSAVLLGLVVHNAAIQDKDGATQVLKSIVKRWPALADGGYAGPKLKGELKRVGRFALEIVRRPEG
jgi:putative transposase